MSNSSLPLELSESCFNPKSLPSLLSQLWLQNFTLLLKSFNDRIPCCGTETIAFVFAALGTRPVSILLVTYIKYNVHFSSTRTRSDWGEPYQPHFSFSGCSLKTFSYPSTYWCFTLNFGNFGLFNSLPEKGHGGPQWPQRHAILHSEQEPRMVDVHYSSSALSQTIKQKHIKLIRK